MRRCWCWCSTVQLGTKRDNRICQSHVCACLSLCLWLCVCVSCRATSCSSCQRNRRHIPSQLTSPSPSSSSVARRGRIYKFLRIFISVSIFCCCCVFPSRVHSSHNCFGFVYHLNIKAKCEDDSFRCLLPTPSHLLLPPVVTLVVARGLSASGLKRRLRPVAVAVAVTVAVGVVVVVVLPGCVYNCRADCAMH